MTRVENDSKALKEKLHEVQKLLNDRRTKDGQNT